LWWTVLARTDCDLSCCVASQGKVRRSIDEPSPSNPVVDGLPEWTDGIVDTHCIAASGSRVAFVDQPGKVYVSQDSGRSWSRWADDLPAPSGIHLL
jgi:hypothetical protein